MAMDETAVWQDMLSNTTVDSISHNTIAMKTTGHEKTKVSAKADGTKLKPFIVFPGAKRETILNEEFKAKCVVASSSNGWNNSICFLNILFCFIPDFAANVGGGKPAVIKNALQNKTTLTTRLEQRGK